MKTKTLTRSAIMIALATVLSMIKVYELPNGGSITAASMVPIIFIALSSDFKTAMLTSLAYAGLQMAIGFYPPPTQDFMSFLIVILFDYVIAFGVLGLAGVIARGFKNKRIGTIVATICVCAGRFVCHFISGITIWKIYAPEGTPVWAYSLGYNGGYMAIECVVSVIAISLLYKAILSKEINK